MAKFNITPDQNHIGFWNIYEGWWIFKICWTVEIDDYYYGGREIAKFATVEEAKAAIDEEIAAQEQQVVRDESLRKWRKTPSVKYP